MVSAGGIPINFDPNLFDLGPLLITWHGIFTAAATLVGVWLAVQLAGKAGFTEDDTVSVTMYGIIGAILGARLFHVLDHWDFYSQNPSQIALINAGGLAIWGALICGPAVGAVLAWRRKLNVARLADVASIPLVLGMAIGRIGDVISGEQRGAHASGFPLAVVYTNPNTLGEPNVPVHLAAGYELLLDVAICVLLLWLARAVVRRAGRVQLNWAPRTARDGMLFCLFLALYAIGRFVVELYRQTTTFALGLSQAQLLSVLVAMLSIWALAFAASHATRSQRAALAAQPGTGADGS